MTLREKGKLPMEAIEVLDYVSVNGARLQRSDPSLEEPAGADVDIGLGLNANLVLGPGTSQSYTWPREESLVAETQVVVQIEGGASINKHTRFLSEDSDISEFSDSLEDHVEEQERILRAKNIRRHKRKLAKGVANPLLPPMENRKMQRQRNHKGCGWCSMEERRLVVYDEEGVRWRSIREGQLVTRWGEDLVKLLLENPFCLREGQWSMRL